MMLIDSLMLMRRCQAKMDFLKNSKSLKTGMEFGTLRSIEMLEKQYPDQKIVICFDSRKRGQNTRRNINTSYKANRAKWTDEFKARYAKFKKFLECAYATCEQDGCEADDVMYALSRSCPGPHYIYTNDDDLLQAVNDKLEVKVLKSWNSKLFPWNEESVLVRYGVKPKDLAVLRAFTGDKSDNLKGVERIGKAYLTKLVRWCAKKNKDLNETAKIIRNADWKGVTKQRVIDFFDSFGFKHNHMCMILEENPHITIQEQIVDSHYVIECLNEWEIATLKICEEYKGELIASLSEEF